MDEKPLLLSSLQREKIETSKLSSLAKIIANIINGSDDGSQDEYLQRNHEIYIKAKALQKKYLDEDLVDRLATHLMQLVMDAIGNTTLIIVGMENYVVPKAFEYLIQAGWQSKQLSLVLIDPIAAELDMEGDILRDVPNLELRSIVKIAKGVDAVTAREWNEIAKLAQHHVIFANLSLHFIKTAEARNSVFSRLNTLGKSILWIRERELNLMYLQTFAEKIAHVYDYYVPRFNEINQLDCSQTDKEILYNWYAIQVKDALNDLTHVACTHLCESGANWLARAAQSGFFHVEKAALPEAVRVKNEDGSSPVFFSLIQARNY